MPVPRSHPASPRRTTLVALAFACAPVAASACSACGCLLTSDWSSAGLSAQPGLRFDLRYDQIDQKILSSGTHRLDRAMIPLPQPREIEQRTVNNYVTASIDYSTSADWGVTLSVPYIGRGHTTIAPGDTAISTSRTSDLGDMRVVGRFQGFKTKSIFGVELGLKLPTGGYGDSFIRGPQAGQPLDRGLQAGTGTTDAIVGVYHFGNLPAKFDYFVRSTADMPLAPRDHYKPGIVVDSAAGVRYLGWGRVIPELALNLRLGQTDTGVQADRLNSGGELLYLTPGASARIAPRTRLYAQVGVPLYERVVGYQLTVGYTAATGVRFAF